MEERPGEAGALRKLGGLGGHFGAPHVDYLLVAIASAAHWIAFTMLW